MRPPYTTVEGDTVDLIAHRLFGVTREATEAILRANAGLAAAGTLLPSGMVITIPDFVPKKRNQAKRIWS